MRVLMVICFAFGILFGGMAVTRAAFAQGTSAAPAPSSDTPEEAKRRGDEAMVALRYQDALDHYQRAYEGLGEFPKALDALEEFNDKAPTELKSRVSKLDEILRDVRNRVATLVVSCSVGDADIRLGEKMIGRTRVGQTVFRVNAGKQKLVVSREGDFSFEKDLTLRGATVETVDVTLASRTESALLRVTSPAGGVVVAAGERKG